MKRDVVIPYLQNNSGELETCVALINKNLDHNRTYVITEYENYRFAKLSHINQILKLKWAIENLDLTNEIILFNDDFFIMQPTEIPVAHKGTLAEHYAKTNWMQYKRAIKETLSIYPEGLSYELHIPMVFDTRKLYKAIESLKPRMVVGRCPLIRSYYGNMYQIGGELMSDVKNITDYEGKPFLSTNERTFNQELGEYIRNQL